MNTATQATARTETDPLIQDIMDRLKAERALAEQGAQRAGEVTAPAGRRQRRKRRSPMNAQTTQTATPTPTTAPQQPGSNLPKFGALLEEAEKYGASEAEGQDTQIKYDLTVANAANTGVIDLTPNKHGKGIDDAMKLSEAYVRGRNKAIIFNHREPKQRKLGAITRLMIRWGGTPKFNPMPITNDLLSTRQALRRKDKQIKLSDGVVLALPEGATRLDDANNSLMRFARAQLKLDVLMSPQEMLQFCFRNAADPQTVEEWLVATSKKAAKLGEPAILRACNTRLTELGKAKQQKAA